MPNLDGPQHITHRPGSPFPLTSPRQDFAQHFFAGGNALMPALLAATDYEQRQELPASSEQVSSPSNPRTNCLRWGCPEAGNRP